jgi:hypothetical protein
VFNEEFIGGDKEFKHVHLVELEGDAKLFVCATIRFDVFMGNIFIIKPFREVLI